MRILSPVFIALLFLVSLGSTSDDPTVLLDDDFSDLRLGMFSVGTIAAHAEYHYLPEVAPKEGWVVSNFDSDSGFQRAWRVERDARGRHLMVQSYAVPNDLRQYTHPVVVAGDSLWRDYRVAVSFAPEADTAQSGLVFRYQNDRCYYFFGVDGSEAVLKRVRHATGYHEADEEVLARKEIAWKPGQYLRANVSVQGPEIRAELEGKAVLQARDSTYQGGRVGLTSDLPTRYRSVKVTATAREKNQYQARKAAWERELDSLQAANPKPTLWKKISTDGFGVGRNLRFGDLNGDGQKDVLVAQVKRHGPKDRNSEVGALTAMTFDGEILWQVGRTDAWNNDLTNDVGVQIHDLDGDGQTEVIYCKDFEIVVVDGATGKIKYKAPTPKNKYTKGPFARFDRILGDALYFLDLRGTGHDGDIIIKDRYQHFWALNDSLEVMWEGEAETGHYPYGYDVDQDGKDELAIGYSLFDDDGERLWSLDDKIHQHADGVAVVDFDQKESTAPRIFYAASDAGMLLADLKGNILKRHFIGHAQNPSVANYRDDLPGLESVTIDYWHSQGIITFYDTEGHIYHQFEPVQHGSMMLPINWTGRSEEYFVLSADVEEGGFFDGWGRKVVELPADGHPVSANAVLDVTGDARDELVVWDPYEIWVYTQEDNPKEGKLYQPERNPLYNYSNYQETVSLPGWSE